MVDVFAEDWVESLDTGVDAENEKLPTEGLYHEEM